jgi:hypothetical protein
LKLGFFVPSLSGSQLAYSLIREINKFYESGANHKINIAVFYEHEVLPVLNPDFMISNATDAFGYTGHLVSTTLSTAYKALRFPSASHSFFVYDLEWIGLRSKQYETISTIYQKPKQLLVRSTEHGEIIQKVWGRSATEVGNFNIEKIIKILEGGKAP